MREGGTPEPLPKLEPLGPGSPPMGPSTYSFIDMEKRIFDAISSKLSSGETVYGAIFLYEKTPENLYT